MYIFLQNIKGTSLWPLLYDCVDIYQFEVYFAQILMLHIMFTRQSFRTHIYFIIINLEFYRRDGNKMPSYFIYIMSKCVAIIKHSFSPLQHMCV